LQHPLAEDVVQPIQTVLCPVDGSECSDRALAHAAALCQGRDAMLVVLTVRPVVPVPALWLSAAAVPTPEVGPEEMASARLALAGQVRQVTDYLRVELEVAVGDVVTEILRVAAARGADLLVVGTHGLRGLDRLVLGSVTERLLRKAACPVLVVPKAAADAEATRHPAVIVCGVDRAPASRRALIAAGELSSVHRARLVLVHVFEDFAAEDPRFAHHFNTDACWHEAQPEIRAAYEAMVPPECRTACEVEVVTRRGRPYRVILEAATSWSADLIVLGAAGWNPPYGSTTARVLREARCPVLVIIPGHQPS
jgi:nucleotide-binding universal stress UspA family protein